MSDEDNMMDDEDYEFDYENSDQDQDDGQVDMENEYYTAKGITPGFLGLKMISGIESNYPYFDTRKIHPRSRVVD